MKKLIKLRELFAEFDFKKLTKNTEQLNKKQIFK